MYKNIKLIIIILVILWIPIKILDVFGPKYETGKISVDEILLHIEELGTDNKVVGSEEHKLTQDYIITYLKSLDYTVTLQEFNLLTATESVNEHFYIGDDNYRDSFTLIANGYSSSIDFEGEVVFVNPSTKYNEELVNGRVVVATNIGKMLDSFIEELLDLGCEGILLSPGSYYDIGDNAKDIKYKRADTVPLMNMSEEVYEILLNLGKNSDKLREEVYFTDSYTSSTKVGVGVVSEVMIKSTTSVEMVKGKNIFASHPKEGKKNTLMFSSNYDSDSSNWNISSVAANLSIAKRLKDDFRHNNSNVVFAFFDATSLGGKGSEYYIDNPLYDKENTSIIALDKVGKGRPQILSLGGKSNFLKHEFLQYESRVNENISVVFLDRYGSTTNNDLLKFDFVDQNIILLGSDLIRRGSITTASYEVNKSNLNSVINLIDYYLKESIYNDYYPYYMNNKEWLILVFMTIGVCFIVSVKQLKERTILDYDIEKLYYSLPYNTFLKLFNGIFIFMLTVFIILGISKVPTTFDMLSNGQITFNYSIYSLIYEIIISVRDIALNGLGKSTMGIPYLHIIVENSLNSFKLLTTAIVTAIILGLVIGIISSYFKKKHNSNQSMLVIFGLSIPEALITFVLLLFMSKISSLPFIKEHIEVSELRTIYMPIFTMAFIPTIYVSRIVYITLIGELKKKYIISLKAKGVNKFRLYSNHLLKISFTKILDIMPILLSIGIANMILCEFIFSIPGIVLNMFDSLQVQEYKFFLGLSISIMFYYYIFILISKITLSILMPKFGGAYEVE